MGQRLFVQEWVKNLVVGGCDQIVFLILLPLYPVVRKEFLFFWRGQRKEKIVGSLHCLITICGMHCGEHVQPF